MCMSRLKLNTQTGFETAHANREYKGYEHEV